MNILAIRYPQAIGGHPAGTFQGLADMVLYPGTEIFYLWEELSAEEKAKEFKAKADKEKAKEIFYLWKKLLAEKKTKEFKAKVEKEKTEKDRKKVEEKQFFQRIEALLDRKNMAKVGSLKLTFDGIKLPPVAFSLSAAEDAALKSGTVQKGGSIKEAVEKKNGKFVGCDGKKFKSFKFCCSLTVIVLN